jgi:hypothetical protein
MSPKTSSEKEAEVVWHTQVAKHFRNLAPDHGTGPATRIEVLNYHIPLVPHGTAAT